MFFFLHLGLVFFFLTQALNKGDKPQIIADRIDVNHLDMGSIVCQSSTLI